MQLDQEIKAHKQYSQLLGKNIQETIDICSERLNKNPNDLVSLVNLAKFASKTGQNDIAYDFLNKATNIAPLEITIKKDLIVALVKLEKFDEAKKEINNILENYRSFKNLQSNQEIFDFICTLLNNIFDDTVNTTKTFELSMKEFPEYSTAFTSYCSFLIGRLSDIKKSKKIIVKALKKFGPKYEIFKFFIELRLKQRQFRRAENLNKLLIKKYPEFEQFLLLHQYDIDAFLGRSDKQKISLDNWLKDDDYFCMALNFYAMLDKNILKNYDLDFLLKKFEALLENKTDDLKQRPTQLLKMSQICDCIARKYSQLKDYKNEFRFLKKSHNYFYERKWVTKNQNKSKLVINSFPLNILNTIKALKPKISELNIKPNNKIKPIFIVGMPRTGTTLVEKIITYDAKIQSLEETGLVPAFVKRVKGNDSPGSLNQMYKELYNINNENFTDKDLFNFNYIEVIINEFPNAKFVNCQREPKEIIMSIFKNRLEAIPWAHSLDNIIEYYDQYLKVMEIQRKKFGEFIIDIDHKELVSESKYVTQKLFSFLGLRWSEDCLKFHKNKSMYSQTLSQSQIRNGINSKYLGKYKELNFIYDNYLDKYKWLK